MSAVPESDPGAPETPEAPGADLPPREAPPTPRRPGPPPLPPRVPAERPASAWGAFERDVAPGAAAGADTYVPVLPARRIRWWALLLGLACLALGLWLVLVLVPEQERAFEAAKADGSVEQEEDDVRGRARRFRSFLDPDHDEPKYWVDGEPMGRSDIEDLQVGAWFFLLSGLAVTTLLGTHRPGRRRFCDVCGRDVIAVPVRGWRCERCNTRI